MAITAMITGAIRDGNRVAVNVNYEDLGNELNETKTIYFDDPSSITSTIVQNKIRDEGNKYKVILNKLSSIQAVSGATLSI